MERTDCRSLVQDLLEHRAELLVVQAADGAELARYFDAIEAIGTPRPALLVACASADLQARGTELGVAHWLEAPPADWDAAMRWTLLQSRRVAALQQRLDERRWTERAKGCLMAAQQLDEPQAHRLLRETAMHARLPLSEVASSVVRASQLAEAVNRAGQQRMLSQRLIKLMAQRAAGIEVRRARLLQDESTARVRANLARLGELLAPDLRGHLLEPLHAAWALLAPCLRGRPEPARLAEAEAAARQLLQAAEALVRALVEVGARPALCVLDLCGRQRLLGQRLAVAALLANALPDPARQAAMARDAADFTAALDELDASPLADQATLALLADVRAEWLRLLHALRHGATREAGSVLARASEALLVQLDALTLRYQQSLHTLLS